jgi:trk system potassium uptake protein TrkH
VVIGDRFRRISSLYGTILKWFSVVYLVPLVFAILQGTAFSPFLVPMVLSAVIGQVMDRFFAAEELEIRDGFLLVVLTWLSITVIGAIPYVLAGTGSLADPVNALFESASGFTATGSTAMADISLGTVSYALMFYRQFSQWLGGMGVLVLAVAVLPKLSAGGAQFLDAEVPGHRMERLTPHIAETARQLWIFYIGLSGMFFAVLYGLYLGGYAPKMTAFQAISHVFTTIACAGFSPQARSIEVFAPVVQWVFIPFIVVSAMNMTLLWRAVFVDPRELWKDTEWTAYIAILVGSGLTLSYLLWEHAQFETLEATVRHGFFQVASILTTTGYASTDFALWDGQAQLILFMLMFVGGCAGSPSGSLKVMRWVVAAKTIAREIFQMIHPSAVRPMRMGKRVVREPVVRGIFTVIVLYGLLFFTGAIFLSLDAERAGLNLEFIDVLSSVGATLMNVGPGMGIVGPMENFSVLPDPTKLLLTVFMVAGRLEVMSFVVVFSWSYWRD